VIRFAAIVSVVAVAIGLLIAGAVSGDLSLVYVSIGLAALALLMLVAGVAIWRDQVFGGGTAARTKEARPDASAADIAALDAWLPDAARQADARRAEPGGLTERKPEHRPAARQLADAPAGRDGRQSPGRPSDWQGDPGHGMRDQQAEPAWEWPARPEPPEDQPARRSAPEDQPARKRAPEDQPPRRPAPQDEPAPAVAADVRSADDPTRLARRLGSAAELSRQPSAPAGRTSGGAPSADPLTGPPPAAATTPGRTRLQKEAAAAAAAKSSAGTKAEPAEEHSADRDDAGSPPAAGADTPGAGGPGAGPVDVRAASAGVADAAVADAEKADAEKADAGVASAETAGADTADADEASADKAGADAAISDVAVSDAPASDAVPAGDTANADTANGEAAADPESTVSVVPGIARYHTTDCILIRFLSAEDLETMTRQAAEASGCMPCRACRPEQAATDA